MTATIRIVDVSSRLVGRTNHRVQRFEILADRALDVIGRRTLSTLDAWAASYATQAQRQGLIVTVRYDATRYGLELREIEPVDALRRPVEA